MKRTQIQIDEWMHEAVRQRAYQEGRSMSDLIRSLLAKTLKIKQPPAKLTIKNFTFIGAGHSHQSSLCPVSERHAVLAFDSDFEREGFSLSTRKTTSPD